MGWCAWDESCRHEVLRRDARRDAKTTVGIIATWKFHNYLEDSHTSVYIFRTSRKLLLSTTDTYTNPSKNFQVGNRMPTQQT